MAGTIENAANVEAINDFMHRETPKTPQAAIAFNDWVQWYEATKPGFFSFWSDADVDHARNLRNAFNRANAVTAPEKKQVEEVIKTGVSLEQAKGETDRRNAEGNITEAPPGVAHQWWFWPAVAGGATAVILTAGPALAKVYVGAKS
jgi:hypothetical protein